jgi:hypothetical protein
MCGLKDEYRRIANRKTRAWDTQSSALRSIAQAIAVAVGIGIPPCVCAWPHGYTPAYSSVLASQCCVVSHYFQRTQLALPTATCAFRIYDLWRLASKGRKTKETATSMLLFATPCRTVVCPSPASSTWQTGYACKRCMCGHEHGRGPGIRISGGGVAAVEILMGCMGCCTDGRRTVRWLV